MNLRKDLIQIIIRKKKESKYTKFDLFHRMVKKLSNVTFIILFFYGFVSGITIEKPERIYFSSEMPKERFPIIPRALAVTEDGWYIIPDQVNPPPYSQENPPEKAGNIKIYKKIKNSLEFFAAIEAKGIGNSNLGIPTYCFYNKKEGKLTVFDSFFKKILVFYKNKNKGFKLLKIVPCPKNGTDIIIAGTEQDGYNLIIAGYSENMKKEPFDLYQIDVKSLNINYLLPSYEKYGLEKANYISEYFFKPNIRAIGISAYFDTWSDRIFYTWEGGHVILLNQEGTILKSFDMPQTKNYIKPIATPSLILNQKNNPLLARKERFENMSFIKGVFASEKYFYIIYEGPAPQNVISAAWVQTYDHSGNFKGEVKLVDLPKGGNKMFWFDKDTKIFYSLSADNRTAGHFVILEYHIKE